MSSMARLIITAQACNSARLSSENMRCPSHIATVRFMVCMACFMAWPREAIWGLLNDFTLPPSRSEIESLSVFRMGLCEIRLRMCQNKLPCPSWPRINLNSLVWLNCDSAPEAGPKQSCLPHTLAQWNNQLLGLFPPYQLIDVPDERYSFSCHYSQYHHNIRTLLDFSPYALSLFGV